MKGFVWSVTICGGRFTLQMLASETIVLRRDGFDLLRPALLDRTCRQTNLCTELKFWSFLNDYRFAFLCRGLCKQLGEH